MKELSIEEKAKAYDEALERAKKLKENPKAIFFEERNVHVSDYIFPELKESEDEKIRKVLIGWINLEPSTSFNDTFDGFSKEQILAWLEKQGAKVSAIEGFETEFERQVSYLIASAISKEYEYNQGYVKWTANALLNYAKHELEKQGWQKPVKVPKFKAGDWITPKDRGHEPWQIMQVDISDKKYRFKDGYIIHFSQEDAYELVEQKPAWSEEDEKILNSLISSLVRIGASTRTDSTSINYTFSKEIDWLESLKDRIQPQPKQEWSEEDERIIMEIISDLDYCKAIYTDDKYESIDNEIDWLKSLRPQNTWKPSDEQIGALEHFVRSIGESGFASPYESNTNLVYSLLSDLKKLKG